MADYSRTPSTASPASAPLTRAVEPSPGKRTLTEQVSPGPVQQRSTGDAVGAHPATTTGDPPPVQRVARGGATQDVHAAAAQGIQGPATSLPHAGQIQASFGRHDVNAVQAHVGGPAAEATSAMGAEAYATGNHVAFGGAPDLHTAAHEAAHVVQQRAGVQLKGGVGEVGDSHEQHADAVADKVVRGESAEGLLDHYAAVGAGDKRQKKGAGGPAGAQAAGPAVAPSGSAARDGDAEEASAPTAEGPIQLIKRTVSGKAPVIIDINGLDDNGCREHLQRIGRITALHPQGDDSEYQYDPGDRDAIKGRQTALLEARRVALVNALAAQLAGLGTAADHHVQPPWAGKNPASVEGPEVAGGNVQPVEATIVAAWTAFLGAGPYSHKHPRTGVVDATRLVSADGQRSIRYGNHERGSNAANHHFHQETWVYNSGANTVTVNNTMRRASVK